MAVRKVVSVALVMFIALVVSVACTVDLDVPQKTRIPGTPGSCHILEERYCSQGTKITLWAYGVDEWKFEAYTLPFGTKIFAPAAGVLSGSGSYLPLTSTQVSSTEGIQPAQIEVGAHLDGGGCPRTPCPIVLPSRDYVLLFALPGFHDVKEEKYFEQGQPLDAIKSSSLGTKIGETIPFAQEFNLLYAVNTLEFINPAVEQGFCMGGGNCLTTFKFGAPTRSGNRVTVPFTLKVDRPVGCTSAWASDLTYKTSMALVEPSAGDEGASLPKVVATLGDASGIAAVDETLSCGTPYEGSWIFDVGNERGPWFLLYPQATYRALGSDVLEMVPIDTLTR